MITEASCTHTFYGPAGSVSVRINADVVGWTNGTYPDVNGLLDAMRVAGEDFVARDKAGAK